MRSAPNRAWRPYVSWCAAAAIVVAACGGGPACNASGPTTVDDPSLPSAIVEVADDGSASPANSSGGHAPAVAPHEEMVVAPSMDSVTLPLLDGDVVTLAELGLDFPNVPLNAVPGATVFAPRDLAEHVANAQSTMRYGIHTLTSVGPTHSVIVSRYSEPYSCPNALIIPVPPDQRAPVGTLIVALFGSSLQVGIRTGGRRDAPFLNSYYQVAAGNWFVPTEAGAPGTWLHCTVDGVTERYLSVHEQGGRRLVVLMSAMGVTLRAMPSADCEALPIAGLPEVGDTIRAAYGGPELELVVTEVHPDEQRVHATGHRTQTRFRVGVFAIGPIAP